ncbi:LysR substrate-binding domain-containing protein [Halomonas sp. HK25]|uniref:LysR substrate-binding domain-containing protein n=1 Tax=Halomonas sp. HK25 TaxID=3394321 RepID=UPI0039FC3B2F
MELRHLRYFIAAAEEEHFGRAAERMNITRPAVSQLISDLEGELNTQLFDRLSHQVKLTAAGRALLPRLKEIMENLDQACLMAKRIGQGKSGVLNIGYGSLTLLHPLFRAVIKDFHENYPDVTLSLLELPTSSQLDELSKERIDAGFLHFGPSGGDVKRKKGAGRSLSNTPLETLHIQTGTLGVVLPSDHRLAKKCSIELKELSNEDFVVVPKSSVNPDYGWLHILCKEAGFEPKIVQEVGTIATQLNLISVGMGVGLTVIGRNFIYPSGLAVVALREIDYPTSFVLAWPKGRIEPVLEKFIDTVKRCHERFS